MAQLTYQGEAFETRPGESVLDCLARADRAPPSSCRAGHCQSCLMRATAGELPKKAQAGLKESWRLQGLFLSCVCEPQTALEIADADTGLEVRATLVHRQQLSADVVRLRFEPDAPFEYRAGQFVSVIRPNDHVTRPYSLASLPSDDALEIHVRRIRDGKMSPWLCDALQPGDSVLLRGPSGECFYIAEPHQPLLLGATSTGLAPLVGVVRDALAQGHTGPISLYHGSLRESGLYLADDLAALAASCKHLEVVRCALEGPASEDVIIGPLDTLMLDRPKLAQARAWLCGAPVWVQSLKKKLFLAGMPLRAIATDPFLHAPSS